MLILLRFFDLVLADLLQQGGIAYADLTSRRTPVPLEALQCLGDRALLESADEIGQVRRGGLRLAPISAHVEHQQVGCDERVII